MTAPIVIVGTGLAGYMLAKELRRLGSTAELTLITMDDGDFYSKPLLSTALTNTKTAAMLKVNTVDEMRQQLNATIYTHTTVVAINVEENLLNTTQGEIGYSKLVLACGAEKVRPPLHGNAVNTMMSVNSLVEYAQFRDWLEGKKHLALLGAGLVGCEFANDLVNAGYQVEVIAPEKHPLANLVPEPIGNKLLAGLASKGVTWRLGVLADAVEHADNHKIKVCLSDHSTLEVDGVFAAIGLRPQTLLAQQAGLSVNRGIIVNRWLQTSVENIYALGDCAEVDGVVQMYVAPLLQCARALAPVLMGGNQPVHYPAMPVVIKTPACPVVAMPPLPGVMGIWNIEGEAEHLSALFRDADDQLRGFALVGDKVRDRMALAKQLPVVFE